MVSDSVSNLQLLPCLYLNMRRRSITAISMSGFKRLVKLLCNV
jgi:hypothetical protein